MLLIANVSANWILVFSSVFPQSTTNCKQFCFLGGTKQILISSSVTHVAENKCFDATKKIHVISPYKIALQGCSLKKGNDSALES